MTKSRRLAAVAAVVLAGGCGLALTEAEAGQKASAVIKGTTEGSVAYTKLSIVPGLVDGKSYKKAFKSQIEVPAGNRVVDLYINVRFGFNEMPYKGRVPFRANLAPGRNYVTKGKIAGRHVDVWIADAATSEPATKILRMTIERCYIRFTCPEPRFQVRSEL